jgi:hypothetical protein
MRTLPILKLNLCWATATPAPARKARITPIGLGSEVRRSCGAGIGVQHAVQGGMNVIAQRG